MKVRTRFAPSPTGYLHIGGARTALFSWLYARKHEGTFILRIEDTDRERSTQEAIDAIFEGMQWLNLNYDEGPYFQTERFDRYKAVAEQLLAEGKAYRCYCTKERLEHLRADQQAKKLKPRYDGFCRDKNLSATHDPYVIRFKNPLNGEVIIDDQVYGTVIFQNQELDDLIIVRSDGVPTYNFSVVIDDWDMEITHVIRGDDHLNNTSRQINILNALGATVPVYAHLPMILGPDGKKLSKRFGAASVMSYRDEGYLPEALLNYLVRLGWSHGDQEIFSRNDMIKYFDLPQINKSAAAINPEKLIWLNQHYLKSLAPEEIAKSLRWHLEQHKIQVTDESELIKVIILQRDRVKTLKELAKRSYYFFTDHINYDSGAVESIIKTTEPKVLQTIIDNFYHLSDWNKDTIHQAISTITEKTQLKLGKIAPPIRVAVTGNTTSPPIDLTLEVLGKERTLKRLQFAFQMV